MKKPINTDAMTIQRVWFDAENIYIVTNEGRTIGNPLAWFPKLKNATDAQRLNFRVSVFKNGISWEELDEDLCLEGFFNWSPKAVAA